MIGLAALLLLAAAEPAEEAICFPTVELAERLSERYGEKPFLALLNSDGNVVRIYANRATGTWSMTFTVPKAPATSCLGGAGKGLFEEPIRTVGRGKDA